MYESRDEPLITGWQFAKRLLAHVLIGIVFVAFSLMLGALGHMWFEENVHWHDAALNAAMMVGGLGPMALPETWSGKVFFAIYGAYISLVLAATFGLIIAPVLHRILHTFHLED